MAWSMSIWILIATATAVAAGPLRIPTTKCIPQGSYCMDTVTPCCQPDVLQGFHVRHNERICFIFGQGLCQPLYEIPQVELYVELVRKLNSTNYMELRRAYRRELDTDPQAELVDSRLLRSPTSDNHGTAILIDSPLIFSQMIPNDTAIKLTNSSAIPTQMDCNDTATKLTDPNVSSTHMILNNAVPPLISVQKSSKNRTSEVYNDTATKLTDPNVSSTHMVLNDPVALPVISVQKSSKNITSKIQKFPVIPVQLIAPDTARKVGTVPSIPGQMLGEDISKKKVEPSKLLESKKLRAIISPRAWVQKCRRHNCNRN